MGTSSVRSYGTPYDQNFNIWNKTCNLTDSKRFNMAETTQPAFVNIIWPDREECMLSPFYTSMLSSLMIFGRSLMSQLKGRTSGEGEIICNAIHTGTTWHLCLMDGIKVF